MISDYAERADREATSAQGNGWESAPRLRAEAEALELLDKMFNATRPLLVVEALRLALVLCRPQLWPPRELAEALLEWAGDIRRRPRSARLSDGEARLLDAVQTMLKYSPGLLGEVGRSGGSP